MIKRLKDLPHEERLRNLEQVSLEKRCHREEVIILCKHLKEACKEDGAWVCSVMTSDSIRDKSHKLKHKVFTLNISKHFFTMGITKHQHRLSSE